MGTAAAVIAIISRVLQLLSFISAMVRDRQQQGVGRAQAVADALEQAHKDLALADASQAEADSAHAHDPTDSAFDPDFRRSD